VKYIAKSAAKNINSLDSQTIVPTATMFGRFNRGGVATALLIGGIIPEKPTFSAVSGSQREPRAVKRITRGYPNGR
jgi:hypothetical protein